MSTDDKNNVTVVRELDPKFCIFSAPFGILFLRIGGRSTAIKLNSGGVWLLASTPLNAVTKAKLEEMGPVEYIVAPDGVHHLFLKDYKAAYPEAKLIGVEPHVKKYEGKPLKFDGFYGVDPEDTKYGYEDEIDAVYFSGHQNKDVAFFHKESQTLIEADLLFNLPAKEQYSKVKSFNPLAGLVSPGPTSGLHKRALKSLCTDVESFKKSANAVAKWDIKRIIPCHGEVVETDGLKLWKSAYANYIDA